MCARQSKSNRTYLAGRPAGHRKALVEEREGLGRGCGRRHASAWRRRCRAEGCGCWRELARRKSRSVTGKDAIIEDAEHEDTGHPYTHPCGSGGRPIEEVDSNCVSSPRFPSAEPFERGPKKRRAHQSKPAHDAAQAKQFKLKHDHELQPTLIATRRIRFLTIARRSSARS